MIKKSGENSSSSVTRLFVSQKKTRRRRVIELSLGASCEALLVFGHEHIGGGDG